MIKAFSYQALDNKKVRCNICHHFCEIENNQRGICGVRKNIDGNLYALNYGKTIAVSVDPIEKKPLYHYLPHSKTYSLATVGCNFKCAWCQNCHISQSPKPNQNIIGYDLSPLQHVENAIKRGCDSISYTYSEPTIFVEYAYDIMVLAHKHGLKNIWVTNGYMSEQVLDYILPYLDSVNVDIKGFDEDKHLKFCGGKASPVRHNIKRFVEAGTHLELTSLIVPTFNDDLEEIRKIADFIVSLGKDIPWHITKFMPAYKMKDVQPLSNDFMYRCQALGRLIGVKHIYLGNM